MPSQVKHDSIDLILKEKQRVKWTKTEISNAFTLRYFGKRSYDYIARDLKYPLPSISTLEKYAQKIDLKHGILEDVLVFIGTIARTFSKRDCECVLSFDEMKVEHILEYDPASDEIIRPNNYMQVVMARGLFKNWKQPIFIGFDQGMTKEIILTLIRKLGEKGINVVAIVSDNCQANVGCWKQLGAHDFEHPYFLHPVTYKNVYVVL
uniref:Transposable element P transposase-like RNase H domain-containing protein n=1 Tax=Anopheles stephensi TaxID=30069 RepID=A0A182YS23_ANOST